MRVPPQGDGGPERFEPGAFDDLSPELALSQLPGGRHGLPRAFVTRNQRLRIVNAMLSVLPQHGYSATTIAHITHEAGVSRGAFYAQFASKEDCFLETYALAASWLCERLEQAAAGEEAWPDQVRASVAEALRLLAGNPPLAHLIAVEPARAGAAARARQQACLAHLGEALRAGRPGRGELPAELEELLLGGVLSLIGRYVDTERTERLPEATGELVHYLLIPYLDPGEPGRIAAEAA
ncbi:MAG TPA: TetR/AcrR family transcriptional regulator [Solirubrobacterales bacterium]|nr:TetR/AcrR family transcriptional regulator [Solirubrobacterales bacterium]